MELFNNQTLNIFSFGVMLGMSAATYFAYINRKYSLSLYNQMVFQMIGALALLVIFALVCIHILVSQQTT